MLVALGECYEKLSQQVEAKKVNSYDYSALEYIISCQNVNYCSSDSIIFVLWFQCYWRAYSVGDVERMALLKLAK